MLRDKHLVIDLSKCEIEEDFLECLAVEMEYNKYIGALLLSQRDGNSTRMSRGDN